MSEYIRYRTHLALEKGTPAGRPAAKAQVQVVELLQCRGARWFASSLRFGRLSFDQTTTTLRINSRGRACRQAAGRSTLILSLRMMEKYFNPQSKKLCRTALSSRIAAISRPGWNLTRHTITYLAPCRDDTDLNEQTGECPLHRPGAGRFQCSELESLIGVPCEKMDPQVIDFRPFT